MDADLMLARRRGADAPTFKGKRRSPVITMELKRDLEQTKRGWESWDRYRYYAHRASLDSGLTAVPTLEPGSQRSRI